MADAVKELKSLLRAKEEAFQRGREAGIREAAEVVRDRGPATQDMTSTMICDALDDAANAILALIDKPQE